LSHGISRAPWCGLTIDRSADLSLLIDHAVQEYVPKEAWDVGLRMMRSEVCVKQEEKGTVSEECTYEDTKMPDATEKVEEVRRYGTD